MSASRKIRPADEARLAASRSALEKAAARAVALLCAGILAGAVSACSTAKELAGLPEIEEGAEVEAAAWPRLIDAPAPEARLDADPSPARRRGDAIEQEMAEEAAELEAEAAALREQPVVSSNLSREAAAVRARNAELDAADKSRGGKVRVQASPDAIAPAQGATPAAQTEAAGGETLDAEDLDAKVRAELEAMAAEARRGAEEAEAAAPEAAAGASE